ncbi:YciI family protein [Bosea sp. PAMC 26642]|uniref:YciI family protein n=1 Tax=Bosea sp. (strain PAMC 26642) TaxID=1792307 RepID=UPI001F1FA23D|nr:YciI family protein [Bosea sp. PAMC 26642]
MFAAGPHWTDDEQRWDGEGMVVVRAASLAEAQAVAAADPMHQSGARSYRVRPWLVNEGTITVQLDFATGRFTLT